MKILHFVTFTLLLVGGLNWGLFAITGWDISIWLGGMDSQISRIIYLLVGISALLTIFSHAKDCKWCEKQNPEGMM